MIREKIRPIHNLITEEIFKDISGASVAESLITAILADGKMTSIDKVTNLSCFPHNAIKEKESIRVDVSAANSKDKFKIYVQFGEYREENYEPYYPGRYSKWGDGLKDIFINIVDKELEKRYNGISRGGKNVERKSRKRNHSLLFTQYKS